MLIERGEIMNKPLNVEEIFASNVYTVRTMQERLPREVFDAIINVMEQGGELSKETANVVANDMKEWAVDKGATHYTHWFQPLTGIFCQLFFNIYSTKN